MLQRELIKITHEETALRWMKNQIMSPFQTSYNYRILLFV